MDNDEKKYDRFCAMWQRNRTMVWAICLRHAPIGMLKCEDLVQEVAIALWNDFLNLDAEKGIGWETSWVWWHTRRKLSHLRRVPETVLLPEGYDVADVDAVNNRSVKDTIDEAMSTLSEVERQVVRMRMDGYDYDYIAAKTETTAAAAKQIMFRAKSAMKEQVGK